MKRKKETDTDTDTDNSDSNPIILKLHYLSLYFI